MKIAVIGGSIGGLLTGISLREMGYDIDIFERSPSAMQDRGAGLVIQPDLMDYIVDKGISSHQLFGVPAQQRQILNRNGQVVDRFGNDTSFTSWSYLFKQLKAHFSESHYHYDHRLVAVEQQGSEVYARFANGKQVMADFLIGADGYNSVVREHLFPGTEPAYSGYIAYRGLIPESDLRKDEVDFFTNKFTLYPYANSHLLAYLVPGRNGELDEGSRQLNWVWYLNKTVAEMNGIMTDKDGVLRQFSMPPGFLSQQHIAGLQHQAEKDLPRILSDRVLQTVNPFVQVIVDMNVPQMYRGRIVILGDSASVVRPHTASGTAKAFENAIGLATALASHPHLEEALKYWNDAEMLYAARLIDYGKRLAGSSGLGQY